MSMSPQLPLGTCPFLVRPVSQPGLEGGVGCNPRVTFDGKVRNLGPRDKCPPNSIPPSCVSSIHLWAPRCNLVGFQPIQSRLRLGCIALVAASCALLELENFCPWNACSCASSGSGGWPCLAERVGPCVPESSPKGRAQDKWLELLAVLSIQSAHRVFGSNGNGLMRDPSGMEPV